MSNHNILFRLERFFFFFSLVLLPTQLGKHFWPDFSLIFSIRTDYYSPVIYGWDLLVIGLLTMFLFQGKRFSCNACSLFFLFILSQLGSFFFAQNIGAAFVRLEQYLLVGLWGIYIASQSFEKIKVLLWYGLGIAMLWSSLLGFGQYLMGKTLGLWILGERSFDLTTIGIATFNWYGEVLLRPYATFAHPNVLAAFLLLGIILMEWLKQSLPVTQKYLQTFYWTVMLISSGTLILTFSRVVVGLFLLFMVFLFKKKLRLFLILFLFLLPFLYVRFHSAFNFDQLSFIRREELAAQSIIVWEHAKIFGVGLNNFLESLARGSIVSGEIRFLQPVHTIFLLTLAETGIVGFLGLLILLITPAVWIVRRYFGKGSLLRIFENDFSYLLFCWFCIGVIGLFDHFFLTLGQGLRIFFLIWGISMLQYKHGRDQTGI